MIVVVPGGGPFANAVRNFDDLYGISPAAAHWMAVLAMDQYAHVLTERIPGAVLVEEAGAVFEQVGAGVPAVLAPSRWMRAANVLPQSWEVTSDSIAAFMPQIARIPSIHISRPPSPLACPIRY
jgi:5-(aminomethyl)-3-furanmethanol phosphate kinase